MADRTCRICSAPIFAPSGSEPSKKRCCSTGCYNEHTRVRKMWDAAAVHPRCGPPPPAQPKPRKLRAPRLCRACGALATMPGPACSQECLRAIWRAKDQKRRGSTPKQSVPCGACGEPTGVVAGPGPARKFCPPCAESRRSPSSVIVVLDCVDCGVSFVTRPHIKRLRCRSCHATHLRFKQRASAARYRARKRHARTEVFRHEDVFDRDGWRCGLCGKKINRDLVFPHPKSVSLDHVIPLSLGGEHSMANTQAAHLDCNTRKNAGSIGPEQLRLIG